MALDDIYEFKIHGVCEGQPCLQVWHYLLYSATGGDLDMVEAVNALNTKWSAGLIALMSSNFTLQKISLQLIGKHNAPLTKARSLVQDFIVNATGTVVSAPTPPQCAMYLKLIGVASGDLYLRGAKYYGGIPANAQIGGLINNAYLNDFSDYLTDAITDVAVPGANGGTLRPVVFSRKRYKANQIPYLVVITNWNLGPNMKTQRRRSLGTAAGPV